MESDHSSDADDWALIFLIEDDEHPTLSKCATISSFFFEAHTALFLSSYCRNGLCSSLAVHFLGQVDPGARKKKTKRYLKILHKQLPQRILLEYNTARLRKRNPTKVVQ